MHLVRALGAALAIAAGAAAATTLPATPVAADPPGLRVTNGCFLSVPDPGTTDAGLDLLHALQAARCQRPPPGPDDPAQPRLGRVADHGPGGVPAVAGRRVRRAVLRPARLRRERWPRLRREPRRRGARRHRAGRPRQPAAVGAAGRTRRPAAGRDRRQLRRRLPVPRRLRGAATAGQARPRRARTRDHLERPQSAAWRPRAWCAPSGRPPWPPPACRAEALPPKVYKALVEGAATGSWPDGSIPGTEDMQTFFAKNGPAWQVAQGRRLDIPMLFRQGTTDTLFNLQQGLDNWRTVLTRRARKHSIFIGYNGGHVLPGGLPSRQQRRLGPLQQGAVRRLLRGRCRGGSWTSSSRG